MSRYPPPRRSSAIPIIQPESGQPLEIPNPPPVTTLRPPQPATTLATVHTKSPATPSNWVPDVYSPAFISNFQKSVNTLPITHSYRTTPPVYINFARYIADFSGAGFLKPLDPLPSLAKLRNTAGQQNVRLLTPVSATSETSTNSRSTPDPSAYNASLNKEKDATVNNYGQLFTDLIIDEMLKEDETLKNYNLYGVELHKTGNFIFRLYIPGIRENTPMVQVGDIVTLRQLKYLESCFPPARIPGPGLFTGIEYLTYVSGMDKTQGYLYLKAEKLWIEPGGRFNVIFGVQENRWDAPRRAISDVGFSLNAWPPNKSLSSHLRSHTPPTIPSSFLRRMLFPEKSDGVMQFNLPRGVFRRDWFDNHLNYEQLKAIDSILNQTYGNIPYLISGPPGTGKTKTIVETVLQLVHAPHTPYHNILLCAPSQEAADTLALRLIDHLSPAVLLRLNSPARSFAEVPNKLMTYSCIENDSFSIPAWITLMRFRVVVCSCRDAGLLVEARCTNRDLGRLEKVMMDGFRGINDQSEEFIERGNPVHLHWSALLLDEAGQGIEPEVAIPLSVVAPPEEVSGDAPIFVMAGDQNQLGPNVLTNSDLRISAFERLFRRPIYTEHPLRRELYTNYGMTGLRSHSDVLPADQNMEMLPYLYPPFANLIRNYRSHPMILAVSSSFFYNDSLIPEAKNTGSLEKWSGWPGAPGLPMKFILTSANDESYEDGVSFYNLREIQIVVNTVKSLLDPTSWPQKGEDATATAAALAPIRSSEIAVMSPFREQVKRIRNALRSAGYRNVNVGPVEVYQGSEYRFVIICTTRTRERFLKNDKDKRAGLVFEHRRTNVALTRAKEGLVVIGNPWILERDPLWSTWMNLAWRHNAIDTDPEGDLNPGPFKLQQASNQAHLSTNMSNESTDPSTAATAIITSCVRANVYATTIAASAAKPAHKWKPKAGDKVLSELVSRLETAWVYKSKAREGAVFGLNSGFDEDDPMFLAGIQAEEEILRRDMEYN
ncbi:P-loop containing nucleoside triphosphate hydrolase protein [Pyronema omphalodes]|nr:P-loop containing nucleoside triphosphate hydrolase protein [Pyronema omphalodes]